MAFAIWQQATAIFKVIALLVWLNKHVRHKGNFQSAIEFTAEVLLD
jgi:hypothetical protein